MKRRLIFLAFIYTLYAIRYTLYPAISCAEEAPEPVVVTGDTVEYLREKNKVIAAKNVVVTYQDVKLTCEKITVYLDTREAIAEGNVRITQKGAFFTGKKINYNFDTRKGRVIDGYVGSEPWYGKAEEAEKVSKNKFVLNRGFVTTCDLEEPHYRIQAKQIRIYMGEKVVAKHIVLFIGDMPIFYWPYYVQPLKGRKPHVSVMAGKDKDWGYYVLSAWRYFYNPGFRGDIKLDYREKKGLAGGIDHYYETSELGNGSVKFYYMNENDSTAYEKSGETEERWRLQVRHRWDMGYDTVNIVEFNKLSDEDFIKDYFYREYEEESQPDNYISSITTKRDYTMNILARKRMNKFFEVVERLPEVKIDIKNFRIMDSRFYYKGEASAVFLNKKFPSKDGRKDVNTVRFDAYSQLSYVAKVLGFLNVTPYVGTRQTFYSRNRWGKTNQVRGLFTAGVNNYTKFYRIFNVNTDLLGMDINRLRHIITPSANYYFTHQPTISSENLHQFDSLDGLGRENGVKLSLENKLQTKRPDGDAMSSIDLATLIVSSDYMFRLEKTNREFKSQKFKSVDFHLELNPYPWLFILSKTSINTKRLINESSSVDFVARHGDKLSLGIGHRYENVESGRSNLLTSEIFYKLNSKWSIKVYENLNLRKNELMEQEYTIYRDLHCWEAELTYNIKDQEDRTSHSIWLVFRIKAFPDMPIGFKRTYAYRRPRAGTRLQTSERH